MLIESDNEQFYLIQTTSKDKEIFTNSVPLAFLPNAGTNCEVAKNLQPWLFLRLTQRTALLQFARTITYMTGPAKVGGSDK